MNKYIIGFTVVFLLNAILTLFLWGLYTHRIDCEFDYCIEYMEPDEFYVWSTEV